jgi:predicted ATP-dependent protease
MLSKEVIQAVRSGKFHVYAVPTIDEGIEVLTNVPAGTPGPKGAWTEGSINARVQDRLAELQEVVRKKGVVTMLDREV